MIDDIKKGKIQCMLGDRTGIVKAYLDEIKFIKEGVVILMMGMDVDMSDSHITVVNTKNTIIKTVKEQIPRINMSNNISAKEYEEVSDDDDE
jgi:hypothetical protein